jgi:hypothetical protein
MAEPRLYTIAHEGSFATIEVATQFMSFDTVEPLAAWFVLQVTA